MQMPNRIIQRFFGIAVCHLLMIAGHKAPIFIGGFGDNIEIELLRFARGLKHIKRQTVRRGIAQPFINGDAIAFGFGNFLTLFIQKELIVKSGGRLCAHGPQNFAGELHAFC